jgi:ribosomal protein S18 acetylase RimI-like enzyme
VSAPIAIRRLDERDAPVWRELRMRALREDAFAFLATYDEDARVSVEDIARRLENADQATTIFGAFEREQILGSVGLARREATKARHRVVLWGMYVVPEARRRGVGEALVRSAIGHLRTLPDVVQVELTVAAPAREARRLYRRIGFAHHGEQPRAMKCGDTFIDEATLILRLDEARADDAAPGASGAALRLEDRDLVERLAARAPSESVPVLLELARRHAARKRPAEVRKQYARDPFVAPSPLDLRAVNRLDAIALAAAHEFETVLLSPLAPLGSCAAVSPSHQDRIVSTLRGTEVVSDPTTVLGLECARRLADRSDDVRLCTVHQTVRAQRFDAKRGQSQHFRMFALAEAGRARADHAFEVDAFVRHLRVFWRLLDHCEASGSRFRQRTAKLLVDDRARPIHARLRSRLELELPQLRIEDGSLESGYYAGLRLLLGADNASGEHVNLSDTGLFDWMEKLTSDRRLHFVASGFGLQLVPLVFGT